MGEQELPDFKVERPVKARLLVHTETGEEWAASTDDLARLGYVDRQDAYTRLRGMLLEAFGLDDFDDSIANDVRYIVECGLFYDHSPWAREDGTPWDGEDSESDVRVRLREALHFARNAEVD